MILSDSSLTEFCFSSKQVILSFLSFSFCLSVFPLSYSIFLCLSICQSIKEYYFISIFLSQSVFLRFYLSLSLCLYAYINFCLSHFLSFYLFYCLSFCLSVSLYILNCNKITFSFSILRLFMVRSFRAFQAAPKTRNRGKFSSSDRNCNSCRNSSFNRCNCNDSCHD